MGVCLFVSESKLIEDTAMTFLERMLHQSSYTSWVRVHKDDIKNPDKHARTQTAQLGISNLGMRMCPDVAGNVPFNLPK